MPDKWVVDPEHPEGHRVPMSDEESAQLEVDRQAYRDGEEAEERALAERLRAELESPKLVEQLEALASDEDRDAARRETMRQWMREEGMDRHEMAVLNRLIAEQHEAEGTEAGAQMAEFLRLAAD